MPPSSPHHRRRPPYIVDRNTLRLLLIPEPLIALTYLVAIHARMIQPSLAPLLIIAALPLAAAIVAWRGLRTRHCSRERNWALLEISLAELISAALALATIAALAPHGVKPLQPTSAVSAFEPDEIRLNPPGVRFRDTAAR